MQADMKVADGWANVYKNSGLAFEQKTLSGEARITWSLSTGTKIVSSFAKCGILQRKTEHTTVSSLEATLPAWGKKTSKLIEKKITVERHEEQ